MKKGDIYNPSKLGRKLNVMPTHYYKVFYYIYEFYTDFHIKIGKKNYLKISEEEIEMLKNIEFVKKFLLNKDNF